MLCVVQSRWLLGFSLRNLEAVWCPEQRKLHALQWEMQQDYELQFVMALPEGIIIPLP